MTKLEEEMKAAIETEMRRCSHEKLHCLWEGGETDEAARLAAEVAKKWIEKAWNAANSRRAAIEFQHPDNVDSKKFPPKEQWLKDNGITE